MDFNLRKLESLGGASGTVDDDLLLVSVLQEDGTYLSNFCL